MPTAPSAFAIGLAVFGLGCLACSNPTSVGVEHASGGSGGQSVPDSTTALGSGGVVRITLEATDALIATPDTGPPAGCGASGVGLIYVVDMSNNLFSFDPANGNQFTQVNTLKCPNPGNDLRSGGGTATPFSMGIDHTGRAWVLYTSGLIFNVDVTKKDSPCTAMTPAWTVGTAGFQHFGMGFVADAPGVLTEKLYIAGGAASTLATGNLGFINPTTLAASVLTPLPKPLPNTENSPELTGTGDALLYGYYPGVQVNYVALFDRSSGAVKQTWNMPTLGTMGSRSINAWAFAHHGGKLYSFVTTTGAGGTTGGQNSQVYELDPSEPGNRGTLLLDNTGHVIVGAGVSICAPTTKIY